MLPHRITSSRRPPVRDEDQGARGVMRTWAVADYAQRTSFAFARYDRPVWVG